MKKRKNKQNFETCGAFLVVQLVKNLPANAEDLGSIPRLGRSPREGKGYPLQCSGLENSMDCIVPGVSKSRTQLSDFHSHFSAWNNPVCPTPVHTICLPCLAPYNPTCVPNGLFLRKDLPFVKETPVFRRGLLFAVASLVAEHRL